MCVCPLVQLLPGLLRWQARNSHVRTQSRLAVPMAPRAPWYRGCSFGVTPRLTLVGCFSIIGPIVLHRRLLLVISTTIHNILRPNDGYRHQKLASHRLRQRTRPSSIMRVQGKHAIEDGRGPRMTKKEGQNARHGKARCHDTPVHASMRHVDRVRSTQRRYL